MEDENVTFFFILAMTWPIYLIPGVAVAAPILSRGKSKLTWSRADALYLVVPWVVWYVSYVLYRSDNKTIASAVVESFILGCSLPIGLAITGVLRPRFKAWWVRIGILAMMAFLGFLICASVFLMQEDY